ncbi:hypothetical protein [Streptomyces sp. YIM S03343]
MMRTQPPGDGVLCRITASEDLRGPWAGVGDRRDLLLGEGQRAQARHARHRGDQDRAVALRRKITNSE